MVPVVTHHEVPPRWYLERRHVAPARQALSLQHGVLAVSELFALDPESSPHVVGEDRSRRLGHHALTVDVDPSTAHLDTVAGKAHDALHEVLLGELGSLVDGQDSIAIARHQKHHHVTALGLPKAGEPQIRERDLHAVDKLVHEQVITDQQSRKHRTRRNAEGLDHERADPESNRDRDHQRAHLLPDSAAQAFGGDRVVRVVVQQRLVRLVARTHSSPSLRAARNASWGISTEPTLFIRFLPAFCFSSSLRFLVMSPP